MVVCLSPNGRNLHTEQEPPTRLVVGTVDGVTMSCVGGAWTPDYRVPFA